MRIGSRSLFALTLIFAVILAPTVAFADVATYTDPSRTYTVSVPSGWTQVPQTIENIDAVFSPSGTPTLPLAAFETVEYSNSFFALPESSLETMARNPAYTELLKGALDSFFAGLLETSDSEWIVSNIDSIQFKTSDSQRSRTFSFDATLNATEDVTIFMVTIGGSGVTENVLGIAFVVPRNNSNQYESDLEEIIDSVTILSPSVPTSLPSAYRDPEGHYTMQVPAQWRAVPNTGIFNATFRRRDETAFPQLFLGESTIQNNFFNDLAAQEMMDGNIVNSPEFLEILNQLIKNDTTALPGGMSMSDFEVTNFVINDAGTQVMIDYHTDISIMGEIHAHMIVLKGKYESLMFVLVSQKDTIARDSLALDGMVNSVQFHEIPQFIDVADTNPHANAIHSLRIDGIVSGYDGVHFGPDLELRRGELLKIALEGTDIDVSEYAAKENPFTDVPADHSLLSYILYAYYNGIATGYGDGTFGPDNTATYAETVKMLMKITGHTPATPPEGVTYNLPKDSDLIGYVHNALLLNALYDQASFDGTARAKRDYAAEILYRLLTAEDMGAAAN